MSENLVKERVGFKPTKSTEELFERAWDAFSRDPMKFHSYVSWGEDIEYFRKNAEERGLSIPEVRNLDNFTISDIRKGEKVLFRFTLDFGTKKEKQGSDISDYGDKNWLHVDLSEEELKVIPHSESKVSEVVRRVKKYLDEFPDDLRSAVELLVETHQMKLTRLDRLNLGYDVVGHLPPEDQYDYEKINARRSTAVVTSTRFPKWKQKDKRTGEETADDIRGDLALSNLGRIGRDLYRVIVVDGGSSEKFLQELGKINGIESSKEFADVTPGHKEAAEISIFEQQKPGYSQARREVLEHVLGLRGLRRVKTFVMIEAEKPLAGSIDSMVRPILKDEADIVIPDRNVKVNLGKKDPSIYEEGEFLRGYPPYQAWSEVKANRMINKILVSEGLRKDNEAVLDFFGGTRVVRNHPALVKHFFNKFEAFKPPRHPRINPDFYSNAVYFPVIAAMFEGWRVESIPITYRHPVRQSAFEVSRKDFDQKRRTQRSAIVSEIAEFSRYLREFKSHIEKFANSARKGQLGPKVRLRPSS